MKPKDWFIVGVRLFGIWMLLQCLAELVPYAEWKLDLLQLRVTTPSTYLFHAAVDLIVAIALLLWAPFAASQLGWSSFPVYCCQKCGYDIRMTPERCPECGTVPEKIATNSEKQPVSNEREPMA